MKKIVHNYKEINLILLIVSGDNSSKTDKIIQQKNNWDFIYKFSCVHGLAPMLYSQLPKRYYPHIPVSIIKQLKHEYLKILLINQKKIQEIKYLYKIFNAKKIKAYLLKGIALALFYYDDIALRPMGDIDIYLNKKEAQVAFKKLQQLGYIIPRGLYPSGFYQRIFSQVHQHFPSLYHKKKDILIEIHYQLTTLTEFSKTLNPWLEKKEMISYEGIGFYLFVPEIMLLHNCLHIYENFLAGSIRLSWLYDLHQIIKKRKLNWQFLLAVFTLLPEVSYPIFICNEFLNTPLPENVKIDKKSYFSYKKNFFLRTVSKANLDNQVYISPLKKIKGAKNKFLFILTDLFPRKEYMIQRYQIKKEKYYFLYYFYRVVKAGGRGFQYLYQLIKKRLQRKKLNSRFKKH